MNKLVFKFKQLVSYEVLVMEKSGEGTFSIESYCSVLCCRRKAGRTFLHTWARDFLFLLPILILGIVRFVFFSLLYTTFRFVVCIFYSIMNWILKILNGYSQLKLIYNLEHSTSMRYVIGLFDVVIYF